MDRPANIVAVATDRAPAPAGHYAQGIAYGGQLFVSGQLPVRPDGSLCLDEDFEGQAHQAISNMLEILLAAGATPGHLLKVTAYIVGVSNWPRFNKVFAERLPGVRPARTVVPVTELHHGLLVEIDAIAAMPGAPA